MGLDSWVEVIVAVIGAAATLGAAWITVKATRRPEQPGNSQQRSSTGEVSETAAPTARITFRDAFQPDPVAVKVAFDRFEQGEALSVA